MFLGQARGKIGDIVFYRMNGVQMSRTRNRHPRNPDTNPQKVQRAISATVSQLYRAGRRIFDHSFQGKSVGAKNQHYFISENMKILRSLISAEIDIRPDGVTSQIADVKGRVVMPGATTPVGFDGAILSQGDYQQLFFGVTEAYTPDPSQDGTPLTFSIPAALDANETCAEYATRTGLIANDIYTICGVEQSNQVLGGYDAFPSPQGSFFDGSFFAVRMRVNSAFVASSDTVQNKSLGDIMSIDFTMGDYLNTTPLLTKAVGGTFTLLDIGDNVNTNHFDNGGLWGNIIRSRLDRDLRSTTYMRRHQVFMEHGIIPGYLVNAWTKNVDSVGNSDLILEGGQGFPVPVDTHLSFLGTFTMNQQTSELYMKKFVVGQGDGKKIVLCVLRNSAPTSGFPDSSCRALIINNDNTLGHVTMGNAIDPASYTVNWGAFATAEVQADADPSSTNYPSGAYIAIERHITGASSWPTDEEIYEAAFGVPYSV